MLVKKSLLVALRLAKYESVMYWTTPRYSFTPIVSYQDGVWWFHCGPIEALVERGHRYDKPREPVAEGLQSMGGVPEHLQGDSSTHRDASDPCVPLRGAIRGQDAEGDRGCSRHDTGQHQPQPGPAVGLHKQPDAFADHAGVAHRSPAEGIHADHKGQDGFAAVEGVVMVPDAGVEPARFAAVDFESTASTSSANRGAV